MLEIYASHFFLKTISKVLTILLILSKKCIHWWIYFYYFLPSMYFVFNLISFYLLRPKTWKSMITMKYFLNLHCDFLDRSEGPRCEIKFVRFSTLHPFMCSLVPLFVCSSIHPKHVCTWYQAPCWHWTHMNEGRRTRGISLSHAERMAHLCLAAP